MFARRFRLDRDGNLHADRLFCKPFATDPGLAAEAAPLISGKRLGMRAAKASALLRFEVALDSGNLDLALSISREVHVLMLAQRTFNDLQKRRVSAKATPNGQSGSRPQPAVSRKTC